MKCFHRIAWMLGLPIITLLGACTPSSLQAAFSVSARLGDLTANVQFTDLSTGSIKSRLWNFGDGQTSSTQNPLHTYSEPGEYTVTLTVSASGKTDTETKFRYIIVDAENEDTIMLPGDIPLTMVWIPMGDFIMGAGAGEEGTFANERPVHDVGISPGFWMGKYEVTQAQWSSLMQTAPWVGLAGVISDPAGPAVQISWDDVQDYLTALHAQTGNVYCLPTEAEWEYACRAGSTTRFYWGEDSNETEIGDYAWTGANSQSHSHVVGLKSPNDWGLYDMSGNVWEWCQDWYGTFSSNGPLTNPDGPLTGSERVAKGGGWYNQPGASHRSACRNHWPASSLYVDFGFRLCRPSRTDFSMDVSAGQAPLQVQFADVSTGEGQTITSRLWDFGDGDTSSQANPSHTYDTPGPYTVSLTISTARGDDTVAKSRCIAADADNEDTVVLDDGVVLTLVRIEAGSFTMGAPSNEVGTNASEQPTHTVHITNDFWMGKYPVTKRQWISLMGTKPWIATTDSLDDPDSPAEYVSWNDAQDFITALNAQTGSSFRLPTEAEWEYACRAGTNTRFYWGNDIGAIGSYAWVKGNTTDAGQAYAHVVGLKLPNARGLYDMSGNVWEWCYDRFGLYSAGEVSDPTGPLTGTTRVARGGSWYNASADTSRSARRNEWAPSSLFTDFGFRLALTATP